MQLREWLEREGLTQEALGRRMSPPVSKGKVSHWLNGTRRVSLGEAIQLSALTNREVDFGELWAMYSGRADADASESAPTPAHQPQEQSHAA